VQSSVQYMYMYCKTSNLLQHLLYCKFTGRRSYIYRELECLHTVRQSNNLYSTFQHMIITNRREERNPLA
jgi:hypothetical protein